MSIARNLWRLGSLTVPPTRCTAVRAGLRCEPTRLLSSSGVDNWTSAQVLQLYRRILKAAAKFPSIKRNSIIADIKVRADLLHVRTL